MWQRNPVLVPFLFKLLPALGGNGVTITLATSWWSGVYSCLIWGMDTELEVISSFKLSINILYFENITSLFYQVFCHRTWTYYTGSVWKTGFAKRSNQSILKVNNTEYSSEGLMLKLQNFNHLMPKVTHLKRPWCWKRLKAIGEGGSRGWDGWMASPTQWTWIWANSGTQGRTKQPGILKSTGLQRVRHDLAIGQQRRLCIML